MQVRTGIDIVAVSKISRLKDSLTKIFHPSELRDERPEHLAGIFAAKEAFFKALKRNPEFLAVEVSKAKGKPTISYAGGENISSIDVSISHEHEYAIASVVMLID